MKFTVLRTRQTLFTAAAAAIFGAMLVADVAAQQTQPTLGELAKKEQERRKAIAAPSKVYTGKDVKPAPAPAAAPAAGASATAAPAGDAKAAPGEKPAAGADTPAEGAAGGEAQWRARMADAREALRRSQMFAEALQTRINSLRTDFVNRDDPAQRAQIGEQRRLAIEEQAKVKGEVEAARKRIADIEEEARKAGVPAGWVR